jgi:ribosomal protein S18 acetylase RimI-like enzyme
MSRDGRVELWIPERGTVFDELVLGLPTAADLDRLPATYAEPDAFARAELAELVPHVNALPPPAAEHVVLVAVGALEDWPLWRSARLAALADAPEAFPDAPADWLHGGEDRWRERLLQANAVKLVATAYDVPVGLVRGEIEAGTAWLHSLWVSPRVRGHGLGERLVHAVEAWGRVRSAYLRLAVVPGNTPALALYRRLGFTEASTLGDPLADGTHELIMEKRLARP